MRRQPLMDFPLGPPPSTDSRATKLVPIRPNSGIVVPNYQGPDAASSSQAPLFVYRRRYPPTTQPSANAEAAAAALVHLSHSPSSNTLLSDSPPVHLPPVASQSQSVSQLGLDAGLLAFRPPSPTGPILFGVRLVSASQSVLRPTSVASRDNDAGLVAPSAPPPPAPPLVSKGTVFRNRSTANAIGRITAIQRFFPARLSEAVEYAKQDGCPSNLGLHEPNHPFPSRFYVQVTEVDLVALVILSSFTDALVNHTNIRRLAKARHSKFSEKVDMPIWV